MAAFPKESKNAIRHRLLKGMGGYMWGDYGYSQAHVDRCVAIIDGYLAEVVGKGKLSEEQILAAVKRVVLELNALNQECAGDLIETDQREDLCALILMAAKEAGSETDSDITETWREW